MSTNLASNASSGGRDRHSSSSESILSPTYNDCCVLEEFQKSNIFYLPKLIHGIRSYGQVCDCEEWDYYLVHARKDVLIYEGDLMPVNQNSARTASVGDRKELCPEMLGVVEKSWNFYYYYWYKTIDASTINSSFQIYISEKLSKNPASVLRDINNRFHYWHHEEDGQNWKVDGEISVLNDDLDEIIEAEAEAGEAVIDNKHSFKYSDQSNMLGAQIKQSFGVTTSHNIELVDKNPAFSETFKHLTSTRRKRLSSSSSVFNVDDDGDGPSLVIKTNKVRKHSVSYPPDNNNNIATSLLSSSSFSSSSSSQIIVDQFQKTAFSLQGPFIKSLLSNNRFEWNKSISQCMGSDCLLKVDELSVDIARNAVRTALAEIIERHRAIIAKVQEQQVKKNICIENHSHSQGWVNNDDCGTSDSKENGTDDERLAGPEHSIKVARFKEHVVKISEQVVRLESRRKEDVAELEERYNGQIRKLEERIVKLEEKRLDQVAKSENNFKEQFARLEDRHKDQLQNLQMEQEKFIVELQKKHKCQMDKLRAENENEKIAHSCALNSYLTASCDAFSLMKDHYSEKGSRAGM